MGKAPFRSRTLSVVYAVAPSDTQNEHQDRDLWSACRLSSRSMKEGMCRVARKRKIDTWEHIDCADSAWSTDGRGRTITMQDSDRAACGQHVVWTPYVKEIEVGYAYDKKKSLRGRRALSIARTRGLPIVALSDAQNEHQDP